MRKVETITRKQILDLLERQQYRCPLTGWELTPETASIDHVMPLAKGGDHAISNAQIVDWRVNQAKGAMTNEEFVEMCKAVASTHSDACQGGSGPVVREGFGSRLDGLACG